MKKSLLPLVAIGCLFAAAAARADDPVKVDPKHYKVEFENESVRVLRIHYGPGEKSVMHDHPEAVAIYLTDAETKMTLADGKSTASAAKAGTVMQTPAGAHLPENTGKTGLDLILVELKGKTATK
ncbi:MAG: cytoplasmic protein [Opitutus sp.]